MIESILSGIVGGLVVLAVQFAIEYFKDRKGNRRKLKVGNLSLQILDRDFLNQYEPGKFSLEKIVADFGQPFKKYTEEFEGTQVNIFQYNFQNAKVLFSTLLDSSEIISVTLFSRLDKKNPVLCRMSFEEEDIELGKAFITETIIRESLNFMHIITTFGAATIIQSRYFFRPIKHLTFSYQIGGTCEEISMTKGETIEQVCLSVIPNIVPMFTTHETFFG